MSARTRGAVRLLPVVCLMLYLLLFLALLGRSILTVSKSNKEGEQAIERKLDDIDRSLEEVARDLHELANDH